MTAIDWDAGAYDRISDMQLESGREFLAGVSLRNLDSKVDLVTSDLLEFEPAEPVDLVFSTAALHWIDDQDRLFRTIHGWLRPGGRVAAQFGGAGTCARFSMRS